jgi:hypothetical protein
MILFKTTAVKTSNPTSFYYLKIRNVGYKGVKIRLRWIEDAENDLRGMRQIIEENGYMM